MLREGRGGDYEFDRIGHARYRMTLAGIGVEFEADRLSRNRWDGDLRGELSVACGMIGTEAIDGVLMRGSFNFSAPLERERIAKRLANSARATKLNWNGWLETFCQAVLSAEREGEPSVVLSQVAKPGPEHSFDVDGVVFPRQHPVILFGDGGTSKSYLALYVLGQLARRGHRVMYADWELDQADHRIRLERLFGSDMPGDNLRYVKCYRPMIAEADRLSRLVEQHRIEFLVCDSVAYATNGAPEAAEAAAEYFRAVRQIGVGSLHVAHVTKGENGDQKPFGSVFWHNSARATWYVKLSDASGSDRIVIGLYNRKANLGPMHRAVGFEVVHGPHETRIHRIDLADVDDLAAKLPLWARIKHVISSAGGPQTMAAIANELDAKVDSVEKAIKRRADVFTKLTNTPDGIHRIALLDRRAA